MPDAAPPQRTVGLDAAWRIDEACHRFEVAWKTAVSPRGGPRAEEWLSAAAEADRPALFRELLPVEVFHRRRLGESPQIDEYVARFPGADPAWLQAVLAAACLPGADAGASAAEFLAALRRLPLLSAAQLDALSAPPVPFAAVWQLADELLRRGWLTRFQVEELVQGNGAELLLGAYVLEQRLGEGGMGTVYRARHIRLGKVVAVKVIRREFVADEAAIRRFQREIRAASQLSHPNVVHAYDADTAGGRHFFAMELVEGIDLRRLLKEGGPLPVALACEYARQAALGLQHAFEKGLIHRDLKPSNLLLAGGSSAAGASPSQASTIKLLDLGLARLTTASEESLTTLTSTGAVMGTPDYIAPEQADESHAVDIRADLYSLGCTLYQLLTGRVPFPTGTVLQKLRKHQLDEPEPVEQLRPEVPAAVAGVVRKLMAKRPEDRYQTPADAAAALAAAARTAARQAANPFTELGDGAAQRGRAGPSWRVVAAATVGAVGLTLAALLLLREWLRPADADPPSPRPSTVAATPARQPVPTRQEALAALRKLGASIHMKGPAEDGPLQSIVLEEKKIADGDLVNLRPFPEMRHLHLSGTGITDAGLTHLQGLSELAELRLGATAVGDRGLASLTPLKKLAVLTLAQTRVSSAGMPHLAGLSELNRLELGGTQVTDSGLEHLRPLRKLGVLQLGPHITDAGMKHLEHHVRLGQLSLSRCAGVTDRGLVRLRPLTKLTYLYLDGTSVTDAGLDVLGDMQGLRYLNVIGTKVTGTFLTHLRCQATLEMLYLDRTPLAAAALKDVSAMTRLSTLGLGETGVCGPHLTHLRKLPALATLDLSHTPVGDEDVKYLLDVRSLTRLVLNGTRVTDAGLRRLQSLPALQTLHLRGTAVTADGLRQFRAARPTVQVDR